MKIVSVSPLIVNAGVRNLIFVKVVTSEPGLYGWGEATLEWKTRTVAGAIEDISSYLIGEDPRRIEHLYQIMFRHQYWRPGIESMTAISGIEQALWDIKSKWLNVPLYELLGGRVRDRLRAYTHVGGIFDLRQGQMKIAGKNVASELFIERALALKEKGYTAIKFMGMPRINRFDSPAILRFAEGIIRELREAIGSETDLMIDMFGRCAAATAVQLCHILEPYGLLFLEEPCPPEDMECTRLTARACGIPIATGERLVGRHQFREICEKRICDIIQPDLMHCGGLWEARKIAAMAETFSIGVAPHSPNGPIGTAVSNHFAFTIPNFIIQETVSSNVSWFDELVDQPVKAVDGYFSLPLRPGLGLEVNEKVAAKYPFKREIESRFFHADGSVADW